MKKDKTNFMIMTIVLFLLFLTSIFRFDLIEQLLIFIVQPKDFFVARESLSELAKQHIFIVAVSSSLSVFIAVSIAILTRFPMMNELEEFILGIAIFGQTIPTVAILALLVPFLGYGFKPALVALFIYGILPVLRNTIEGLNTIPEGVRESARAVGMNSLQVISKVELPLAFPAILAGIRVSLILNISVATIGAAVGLRGFGTLIINGIRSNDIIMVLKGAIPVSLLALTVESLFMNLEKRYQSH